MESIIFILIVFDYDANGRRIQKFASGVRAKYAYAGNQLLHEERGDENNIPYFGDDLVAGDSLVEGDGIIVDSINKSVIEYIYGQDSVAGLVYNVEKYYFRRNVQGDITRIYAIDGTLTECYTHDAWGNHKVYDAYGNENNNPVFIGNVNPFRYRGYYYDTESSLIYCHQKTIVRNVCKFLLNSILVTITQPRRNRFVLSQCEVLRQRGRQVHKRG